MCILFPQALSSNQNNNNNTIPYFSFNYISYNCNDLISERKTIIINNVSDFLRSGHDSHIWYDGNFLDLQTQTHNSCWLLCFYILRHMSNHVQQWDCRKLPLIYPPFLSFSLFSMSRCRGNHIKTPPLPGHGLWPKTLAEKKRLLKYGVSFWHWGSAYHRDHGTQRWWKRNVLDFQRKKGAGHREKRLKDMVWQW